MDRAFKYYRLDDVKRLKMEVFNTVHWYDVATVSNYAMRFSVMKALQLVKGGGENIIFIMTKIRENI